tara:strand:+ start:134 stop:355 length:222 start_codon:yes stop_codon:yes gene_type:complete
MKTTMQMKLALLMECRSYVKKMQKGSAFVTDFKAANLMEEMIVVIEDLLSENLKLKKQLKLKEAFRKKKEQSR